MFLLRNARRCARGVCTFVRPSTILSPVAWRQTRYLRASTLSMKVDHTSQVITSRAPETLRDEEIQAFEVSFGTTNPNSSESVSNALETDSFGGVLIPDDSVLALEMDEDAALLFPSDGHFSEANGVSVETNAPNTDYDYVDEDDIAALVGFKPQCGEVANVQWYSVEPEDDDAGLFGVAEVAVEHATDPARKTMVLQRVVFAADILAADGSSSRVASFLFKQLRNVAAQTQCVQIHVRLTRYDDVVVDALAALDFAETGGHFSNAAQSMVHEFTWTRPSPGDALSSAGGVDAAVLSVESVEVPAEGAAVGGSGSLLALLQGLEAQIQADGKDVAPPPPPPAVASEDADADAAAPIDPAMRSLIGDLFRALHQEQQQQPPASSSST
eukprot:gene8072-5814_t